MKKTFKTMLALMAGVMTIAACSNDDILENVNEPVAAPQFHTMTFVASQENQADATRTLIDDDNTIKWTSSDKISVFDGVADANANFAHEFSFKNGSTSSFTGDATDAAEYYALYPSVESINGESECDTDEKFIMALGLEQVIDGEYVLDIIDVYRDWILEDVDEYPDYLEGDLADFLCSVGLSSDYRDCVFEYFTTGKVLLTLKSGVQRTSDDKFENVVIPAYQTAVAGSADPKAMVMIGLSTDKTTIDFKNVCSYIKVTPKFDCRAILITSKGTENLAGTVTVDYNGGAPIATVSRDGSKEILLTGTIAKDNDYYIAVLPGALESGFTIGFLAADRTNIYERSTDKNPNLERSKVTNLGTFETTGTWNTVIPVSGTDGNGHTWLQVTTSGLKIASEPAAIETYLSDAEGIWGDDWVLPTLEDLEEIAAESTILKYVANDLFAEFDELSLEASYSEGVWVNNDKDWLSSHGYDTYYYYTGHLKDGSYDAWRGIGPFTVVYKYVGE